MRDPGLFILYAFLTPGTAHADIERVIQEEIERVRRRGVTREEVEKAKARVLADSAYRQDGFEKLADAVNESIAIGDWRFYLNFTERIRAVSLEDVMRVAVMYFTEDQRTVGWFVPKLQSRRSRQKGKKESTTTTEHINEPVTKSKA